MQNPAQFTLTFTSTNLFLHFIISTALPDSCGQLLKQTLHHTVKQNKSLLSCERKKKNLLQTGSSTLQESGTCASSEAQLLVLHSNLRLPATTQNARLHLKCEFNDSPFVHRF